MKQLRFKEEVEILHNYAQSYRKFQENPNLLLDEIKNLDIEELEKQRRDFSNYISSLNKPYVINFIRFLVLERILNKQDISIELIIEIKENISNKNLNYFIDYPRFKDALPSRSEKALSEQWDPFSILFQIYHNFHKNQIDNNLNYVHHVLNAFLVNDAPEIQGNWAVKIMDFKGPRNFGGSEVWFAFYPDQQFNDHKDAYQIYFNISYDKIEYGIAKGSNAKELISFDEIKQREARSFQDFEFTRMTNFIQNIFSDFKNLNTQLKDLRKPIVTTVDEVYSKTPRNIILYGPPGTGKTFLSRKLAIELIEKNTYTLNPKSEEIDWVDIKKKYEKYKDENRIKFITFHQSYSYEEFIQGYRYKDNKIILKDGIFKRFVDYIHNQNDYSNNFVFIIDEINRGNISKIFGEIITIVEDDKRLQASNETDVILPNTKMDVEDSNKEEQRFILPPNLYIIGTMNTADRSIALMDIALRRRFHFEGLYPDSEIIKNELTKSIDSLQENENIEFFDVSDIEKLQKIFDILNKRIEVLLDRDHMIGHSYFLNVLSNKDLFSLWYGKILPLLNEYFYNDWERLKMLLGEYNESENKGFIQDLSDLYKGIFEEERQLDFPYKFADYIGQKEQFLNILSDTFEIE